MSSSTKKVAIGSRPSKSKAAAAEQWIKTRETAKAGEDDAMKRMTFDMPESLHKRLKLYCVEHGTKMSIVFRDLVENLLENER